MDDLRSAIQLAMKHRHSEVAVYGYLNLAEVAYRMNWWEGLADEVEAGIRLSSERGFWFCARELEVHRILLDVRRGEWDSAESRLRTMMTFVDDPGSYVNAALGRLLSRRGDPEAVGLLQRAWQWTLSSRSYPAVVDVATAYAEWAWLNNQPLVAVEIHRSLKEKVPHALVPVVTELRRYLKRAGVDVDQGMELNDGFAIGTRDDWQSAAIWWEKVGEPYERALELGESTEAAHLRTSLAILDGLDAVAAADLVRRRMQSLGIDAPPPSRSSASADRAGMTDRQLEVLLLVANGLTNAEIASNLYLSTRTVDHHVADILSKLNASSRREAAATARSLGLLDNRL